MATPKKEKSVTEANTEAKSTRTYEAASVTPVTSNVPMPENIGKRANSGRGVYDFDSLEVGQSFGVTNKTAKQIASAVSAANKRFRTNKLDANGAVIYKTQEVKHADGTVTKQPTLDPETVPGRVFVSADVDPATDPDGATVRVWRKA